MKRYLLMLALVLATVTGAVSQNVGDVWQGISYGGRVRGSWGALSSSVITEGSKLFYTDARVRAALSAALPLAYNSSTGQFSFTGLSTLGTANQFPGMNAGATALEWKAFAAGTSLTLTHGVGTVTFGVTAGGIGTTQLASGAVTEPKLAANSVDSNKVIAASLATSDASPSFKAPYSRIADSVKWDIWGHLTLGDSDFTSILTDVADTSWAGVASWENGTGGVGSIEIKFNANNTVYFWTKAAQEVIGPRFFFHLHKKQYPIGGVYVSH